MTVSAVLNNRAGAFSAETRERVLEAIRQSGYRPRAAVRTAAATEVDEAVRTVIGVIVPQDYRLLVSPGYYGEIFKAILNTTHRLGLGVLLAHGSTYNADSFQSIRSQFDGHCGGLLCVAPLIDAPLISALSERGYPFVVVGDTGDFADQSSVDVDHAAGIRLAIDHLRQLGHRRIGFVGGPDIARSAVARHEAYRETLEELGMPYDPAIVNLGAMRLVEHYQFVANLMQQEKQELPTAFVCWNDNAARRAINALNDVNIRVPEEVSVTGFDDSSPEVFGHPDLTSIRQPYQEIGEVAVQLLIESMNRGNAVHDGRLIPPTLIARGSTAPVKQ